MSLWVLVKLCSCRLLAVHFFILHLSIPGPSTQQAKCFLPTLQSSTAALGTEGHGVHVFFRGWK